MRDGKSGRLGDEVLVRPLFEPIIQKEEAHHNNADPGSRAGETERRLRGEEGVPASVPGKVALALGPDRKESAADGRP